MSITLKSLSPNVIVADVNKSVSYYTEKLGFSFIVSVPESGQYNWAMVQRDGVTMMFQSLQSIQEDIPGLKIDQKGSIGTFFIEMNGIDKLYEEVESKVEIVGEMRTTFYGKKEFTVKDLDGYFLTFAEDIQ